MKTLGFLIIAAILSTVAQAELVKQKSALPRLTQDRIVTPIPSTQENGIEHCSVVIQRGIQNFYREKFNRETKNEAGTATVFADSLPSSFPYAEYINIRIAEKERPADRERLREDGFKLYQAHGRSFLPQEILDKAASVILDPYGQFRGLQFFSLQKFVDLFEGNGKYYFLAYHMDSIGIHAGEREEADTALFQKALRILEELAYEGEMKNLSLSFETWLDSSLMLVDALHRRSHLFSNLNHLDLNPGGGFRLPSEYQFNQIPSLFLKHAVFEDGSQVLGPHQIRSHLRLNNLIFSSQGDLLPLIKDPLRLKHLSVIEGNAFPSESTLELNAFQNLTHLSMEKNKYKTPGRFQAQEIAELIDQLPNLTHIAFTPAVEKSGEDFIAIIKKIKSPTIKEIGIFSELVGVGLDTMIEREGLPPIRLVGKAHIHW